MDVARPPEVARQRRRRRIMWGGALVVVSIATTMRLSRHEPAAPADQNPRLSMDTDKRGTLIRKHR